MADRPTTLRPTADVLPADRLRNLVDRACRHLTPAEANALRGALAGTMRNATAAVEGLHQRAADAEARAERAEQQAANVCGECETWKAKAEEIERDRDRIATEHTEFVLKAGEQIGRAQADTELLRRTVRAECDAIEREQYGQHDEDADGMREAARRIRAALDAAGQPDTPAGECGYVDGDRRCIGRPGHDNPRLVHGPWVTHTAQHAREDGQERATGATGATDAPGADDHANGPHAGTDGFQPAYDAVFAYLGNNNRVPVDLVTRNAIAWRAVHAALGALPRCDECTCPNPIACPDAPLPDEETNR